MFESYGCAGQARCGPTSRPGTAARPVASTGPPNSYMRVWLPSGCPTPAETGHRVYQCKGCGVTSYDPRHWGGGISGYPEPITKTRDSRRRPCAG